MGEVIAQALYERHPLIVDGRTLSWVEISRTQPDHLRLLFQDVAAVLEACVPDDEMVQAGIKAMQSEVPTLSRRGAEYPVCTVWVAMLRAAKERAAEELEGSVSQSPVS
jgi:hypothetical protein